MSKSAHLSRSSVALVAAVAMVAATSCRKPDPDLGNGLLPSDPLGIVIDTAQLHAFTLADSNFRSSALSRQLLGSFVDPRFGLTRAGIVTQVRLSAGNIGSGQNVSGLVADSIVLALTYDGGTFGYGNLDAQVFQVHELDERLSIDSTYRSNRAPAVTGDDLMAIRGGRVRPEPVRKPYVMGDSLAPQLRLRLSNELARRFVEAFGQSALSTNDAFLDFFKGLYITVDNGGQAPFQGAVLYFNLLVAPSKLTLYYRDQNSAEPDLTRALDFPINSNCVRYTVVEHDRSMATDPWLSQALNDTLAPAQQVFVQSLAGTRTIIDLRSLEGFRGDARVLAKAELVIPVEQGYYPYYPPPAQLVALRRTSAGNEAFLPDQAAGIGAIDGSYNSTNRTYSFNITRFAQRVITGEFVPRLELLTGSGGITANRVMMNGPAASKPMRLRLTFTSY